MHITLDSLKPTKKKTLIAAAILLIIALVVVLVMRLTSRSESVNTAASGTQSEDGGPASGPQSIAKTITPQSGGPANASGSLSSDAEAAGQTTFVVNTVWGAYTDPAQAQATDLSSVLTASALEEFDAQALEWSKEGTHTEGTPTLENVHILNDDGAGNVTVSACVDSTSVRVLNDAGTSLTDDTTMTRALTYFHFVKDGDVWKMSGLSFPEDPTC